MAANVKTRRRLGVVPSAAPSMLMIGTTAADLAGLPESGAGWTAMKTRADLTFTVDMNDQNSTTQGDAVAAALVYAADPITYASYATKVVTALEQVRTWSGSTHRTAYFRSMSAWCIAAELVGHDTTAWRDFCDTIRYRTTWTTTHSRWGQMWLTAYDAPNNHGAYSLASFLACSLACGDTTGTASAVGILKAWLGDKTGHVAYAAAGDPTPGGWRPVDKPNSDTWKNGEDAADWYPINPATVDLTRDGAVVHDIGRFDSVQGVVAYSTSSGVPTWGALGQDYSEACMNGIITAAVIAYGRGLLPDVWTRGDSTIRRYRDYTARYTGLGLNPSYPTHRFSSTRWQDPLLNHVYGTSFGAVDTGSNTITGTRWLAQSSVWLGG